jgi:hypothetical protein
MAADANQSQAKSDTSNLSLDWWAVIIALGVAFLVKAGWLPRIPW